MCTGGKLAPLITGKFINVTDSTHPDNEHYGRLCMDCMGQGCEKCNHSAWFPNKISYINQHIEN